MQTSITHDDDEKKIIEKKLSNFYKHITRYKFLVIVFTINIKRY